MMITHAMNVAFGALLLWAPAGSQVSVSATNPVQPGLVAWHASFDEARAAAEVSRRPILLFQLLGRLDEEFC